MTSTIPRSNSRASNRGGPGSGPQGGPTAYVPHPREPGAGKTDEKKDRVERAKAAHVMVDKDIQRYAEEHNEPAAAKALGGLSFKDNEPVDIVIGSGGIVQHGVELKTIVKNANAKITMKGDALAKKRTWARNNKATFHTVVLDDSKVFNANGPGKHDESKRVIYYRRGAGSFRVANMFQCKDMDEARSMMDTPTKKLPKGAK